MNKKAYPQKTKYKLTLLLIKLILISLFVVLLIWLLPKNKLKYSLQKNCITSNFNENILLLQNAARNYFTQDLLPNEINNSKTITLEDLYNKKVILELYDSKGNECESYASYVQIIRQEKKYQMNIVLTCGGETKIVTNYFDLQCY